jgi:hypothetical protein
LVKIQFVLRNKHFHLSYKIQSVNLYRKIIAVFFPEIRAEHIHTLQTLRYDFWALNMVARKVTT